MPRKNNWASLYAKKRRAIDKALLAECERQIAVEEKIRDEERQRIAAAFGRPR